MVLLLQMLLDFPKTDINLKSDGGTTSLMDAVKSTNMYMVKQLVKKSADISLTDYEGTVHVVCIVCAYYTITFYVFSEANIIQNRCDTKRNSDQT